MFLILSGQESASLLLAAGLKIQQSFLEGTTPGAVIKALHGVPAKHQHLGFPTAQLQRTPEQL